MYVTHGHGDHRFGVRQLTEAFPAAKAIATAAVAAKAEREGSPPFIDDFWAARFPGDPATAGLPRGPRRRHGRP
jgi:glyoxylase-like metal-dependent hydrolase (beta-lactamase superfamily II)